MDSRRAEVISYKMAKNTKFTQFYQNQWLVTDLLRKLTRIYNVIKKKCDNSKANTTQSFVMHSGTRNFLINGACVGVKKDVGIQSI